MADDLYALQDKLVEAAINAFMRRSAPYILDGSCAEGKFEYLDPGNQYSGYSSFNVTYPGGDWVEDGGLIGGDNPAPYEPFDARQVYADLREAVESWLEPFRTMPDPGDFDGDIGLLQSVAAGLQVGGTVSIDGSDSDTTIEVGNDAVDAYLSAIEDELTDLNGVAMKALRDYYGNRIRNTMSGQHALVVVLGTLVAGEKEAWTRVEKDITHLVTEATGAFNQLAESGSADWHDVISVLGTVSAAAGLFGIPLGIAGTAIGKAKTVESLVSPFLPKPKAAQEFSVTGSTFEDMWESFTTSVQKLDADLTATEDAFFECGTKALGAYNGQRRAFNLKSPSEFLGANGADDSVYQTEGGGRDDEVKVNDALKYVAGRFELVGDHQRELAGMLGGGYQHEYSPAAPRYAQDGPIWHRDGLGGVPLGLSDVGHYPAYQALLDQVIDLLLGEAKEAHRVAEKCLAVLSDFRATDEQIEARLDRQADRIETEVEAHLS